MRSTLNPPLTGNYQRYQTLSALPEEVIAWGEHPCSVCRKVFSQKVDLTTHMRTHTGERPFACDECGRSFSDPRNLTRHLRTHTGERPFACDECGKCFNDRSVLKRHRSTHTVDKPFQCPHCPHASRRSADLEKHKRGHASNPPPAKPLAPILPSDRSCPKCGKAECVCNESGRNSNCICGTPGCSGCATAMPAPRLCTQCKQVHSSNTTCPRPLALEQRRSASPTAEPAAKRIKQKPIEERFSNERTFSFISDAAKYEFTEQFPYQNNVYNVLNGVDVGSRRDVSDVILSTLAKWVTRNARIFFQLEEQYKIDIESCLFIKEIPNDDPRIRLRGQHGLFAKKDIKKNSVVAIYVGEKEFNSAMKSPFPYQHPSSLAYCFRVKGQLNNKPYDFIIDAKEGLGNWSALFNAFKTYAPNEKVYKENCAFVKVIYLGLPLVLVIAIQDIAQGEECLVDYGEAYWRDYEKMTTEYSMRPGG